MIRRVLFVVAGLFVVPVALAVGLAAAFGGWTALVIVLVFWLAFVTVALVTGRFVFRSFGPVRQLVETTDRLAEGDYAARVAFDGSPPLQPVARSVNTMAERLEASERLRQRLLADVGHELRTPLTVIRGSLEAMLDGVRDVDHDQLGSLLIDVGVMERLLDDLRTLSAAEAGRLNLHKEPVQLADVVQEVAASFRAQAMAVDVALATEIEAVAATQPIELDPVRIREVLSNLVTNAIRASVGGGSIMIEAGHLPIGGEVDNAKSEVWLTVSDDGVGMSKAEVAHAFDRFHKSPSSAGSGLGLAISRDLVLAHGGTIDVDSALGRGTTVTVRLPR